MSGFDAASSTRKYFGVLYCGHGMYFQVFWGSILRAPPVLAVVWADTAGTRSVSAVSTAHTASTHSISAVNTAIPSVLPVRNTSILRGTSCILGVRSILGASAQNSSPTLKKGGERRRPERYYRQLIETLTRQRDRDLRTYYY